MLPRLEAERTQDRVNVALATGGRTMDDDTRRVYLRDLEMALSGERRPKKAPRITAAQARALGVRMAPPPESGEGVSK